MKKIDALVERYCIKHKITGYLPPYEGLYTSRVENEISLQPHIATYNFPREVVERFEKSIGEDIYSIIKHETIMSDYFYTHFSSEMKIVENYNPVDDTYTYKVKYYIGGKKE